jgi:hypothetical protein
MPGQCKRSNSDGQRVRDIECENEAAAVRLPLQAVQLYTPPRRVSRAKRQLSAHDRDGSGTPRSYSPAVTDDPGVMGNLPRSRPGRRSDKRAAAGGPAGSGGGDGARSKGGAGSSAKRASGPRSSPKRAGAAGSARRSTAGAGSARTAAGGAPRSGATAGRSQGPDPIGGAVRVAAKVAGTGIGIATGTLRRLPRP